MVKSKFKLFNLILQSFLLILGIGLTIFLLEFGDRINWTLPEENKMLFLFYFIFVTTLSTFSMSIIFFYLKKIEISGQIISVKYPLNPILNFSKRISEISEHFYKQAQTPYASYNTLVIIFKDNKKVKFTEFDYVNFDEISNEIVNRRKNTVPNKTYKQ